MPSPSPVVSVHQQISSRLRADILSGNYAPGEPLREEQLAARFGVSRSPIRQVLQQLTHEGLLLAKPNCGIVVAEPPIPEVMGVLRECRAKLECIALRQCFEQLNHADFDRWRGVLGAMYEACDRNDHPMAYHHDILFHRVVVDKASPAGSMGVYSVIAGATAQFLRAGANRPFHADFRELYAMHAALLAMYRLGDVEIACEALSQHILRGPFTEASCRCWTEAGKPRGYEGIYDRLGKHCADDPRFGTILLTFVATPCNVCAVYCMQLLLAVSMEIPIERQHRDLNHAGHFAAPPATKVILIDCHPSLVFTT